MKLFLIIPDIKGVVSKPTSPHIGSAYLAAVLLKNGHNVRLLDMRFGYKYSYLLGKLKEFKPDFVGITSTSVGHKKACELIENLKRDSFKVLIGGPHASVMLKNVLEETRADFAIRGEGEDTIIDFLNNITKPEKVKGLIWRNENGEIIENEGRDRIQDLDGIPFPAFELFELDKYMDKKLPIVTSRGCPYRCTYCSIFFTMGHKFRARSPENVVNEIEKWYKKGYKYFSFNDDCFTFDMERAAEICELIVDRNLKIEWDLRNGIRIDNVNEQLLRKMKKAGCVYMAFGVESANQDVLNKMRKGIKIEQARNAILLADKIGIKKGAFFIIGMPGGNMETFKQSLDFALTLPLDEVRFYNAIPYPGTELFSWIKENAKFLQPLDSYLDNADAWDAEPIYETEDFKRNERKKAFLIAEEHVMKYLMKREFGKFFGMIGWCLWKPRFSRKAVFPIGKKVWSFFRILRSY